MNKNFNKKLIILISIIIALLLIYLLPGLTPRNMQYFLKLRSSKVFAIILVGYCIGYSTTSFQTLTNNRLLTPNVMGLDALYLFIQTAVVFFIGSKSLVMIKNEVQFIVTVMIMVLSAFVMYNLLFKRKHNIYFLVLSGMIFGQLFNGLANFMQVLLDPNEFLILQGRMFASFSNINTNLLTLSFIIAIAILIITYKDFYYIDVLTLGKDQAITLGINYNKLVKKQLIVIFILISIATVLVGPITFLGLLVVSLAKRLFPTYKHKIITLSSVLISIIFLIGGLLITERVLFFNTTVSTIINFIGGIYFIYLIMKETSNDHI